MSLMLEILFILLEVTTEMIGLAMMVAAVLGLIAAVAPMIAVARTSVVQGLKTLD